MAIISEFKIEDPVDQEDKMLFESQSKPLLNLPRELHLVESLNIQKALGRLKVQFDRLVAENQNVSLWNLNQEIESLQISVRELQEAVNQKDALLEQKSQSHQDMNTQLKEEKEKL